MSGKELKKVNALDDVIKAFYDGDSEVDGACVMDSLAEEVIKGGEILIPIETDEDGITVYRTITDKEGFTFLVGFTSSEEVKKGLETETASELLSVVMEKALMANDVQGLAINPWRHTVTLEKHFIREIFENTIPAKRENVICVSRTDITEADTDCIVNAANKSLLGGGGVDGAIHKAAGPLLKEECKTLNGCETGEAKITKGYNLRAKYVIHTVGPVYSGSDEDREMLRRCYWNSLELAKKNDLHSIAFPSISTGVYGYPKREAAETALGAVSDWMKVNPHYGMAILMACFDDETYDIYHEVWAEIEKKANLVTEMSPEEGNELVNRAVVFAAEKHKGAFRKGTNKPYILHPAEVLEIVGRVTNEYSVMAAAVLHDVLEDTDTSLYEMVSEFGTDIAWLVNAHTEDKRKNWYVRKATTIFYLKDEILQNKLLTLADKLANMRSIYSDYMFFGDDVWSRFNAPKEMIAWYYSGIIDNLAEFMEFDDTKDFYWELVNKYKDVFVKYYLNEEDGTIYQIGASGEGYVMTAEDPSWNGFEDELPEGLREITRSEAEWLVDERM